MLDLKVMFVVCLVLIYVFIAPLNLENGRRCMQQFNCGKIRINVGCPFQVEGGDFECCGQSDVRLSCEHNRTVLYLGPNSNKYYVAEESIRQIMRSKSIRIMDPGVVKNNCSTVPLYSILDFSYSPLGPGSDAFQLIFVSCKRPVHSSMYVDTTPCLTAKEFSNQDIAHQSNYSYVVVGKARDLGASDIEETCTIHRVITSRFQLSLNVNLSFQDIHDTMASGFVLKWSGMGACKMSVHECYVGYIGGLGSFVVLAIGARAIIGAVLLVAFLFYKCQRRHLSIYDAIEEFLQSRNNLIPIRYSYKQIKKMTNNFKEKLGEGGYGCVYKGKLRSGELVAIKMLSEPKANGQEFINEVATLGRIHHVNVVRLVGFCVTASKRALVYDYMPNGSLEKFIFSKRLDGNPLSWKKAIEITMGVARGIEYLHQGCSMQILHFDIKPHNILLDENFTPKVSDFGLAKLHPVQNSVVSLTAVRGTLGYMAPELFYKRVGKVSSKADVYSFGMLLMEMVGRRRNVNAHAEHSSQTYFPSWISNKVDQGGEVDIGEATEDEKGIARKLTLIALWCIQMPPDDRPSMREVVEMLQADLTSLQLPPKPLFYPPDSAQPVQSNSYSTTDEVSTTLDIAVDLA
ncbi:rust resistance kinase Lr10-like [Coffea arabica]|uniref:Rust resistance kinase Lr10-like n=1 Tax=Coffea arabica TaxID=13443 RepID=A0ABM4US17_COFAR|nr:rust resistance kinase Lr10-like [Coffea arabica]